MPAARSARLIFVMVKTPSPPVGEVPGLVRDRALAEVRSTDRRWTRTPGGRPRSGRRPGSSTVIRGCLRSDWKYPVTVIRKCMKFEIGLPVCRRFSTAWTASASRPSPALKVK